MMVKQEDGDGWCRVAQESCLLHTPHAAASTHCSGVSSASACRAVSRVTIHAANKLGPFALLFFLGKLSFPPVVHIKAQARKHRRSIYIACIW
jgi:hypothetical protein